MMNASTHQRLETELDAFLAEYQHLPLIGASDGLHARKKRFLEKVTSLFQQPTPAARPSTYPTPDPTSGRGRPALSSNADVIRAGLQLESEGKRVTGSKLRSLLGGGRVDRYASIWADYVSRREQDAAPQGTHPVAEVIARQRLENESTTEVPRIVALDATLPVGSKLYTTPPAIPN